MRFGISFKSICIRKGHPNFGRREATIWWNYRPLAIIWLWKVKV